ncbi:MAG: glycosyltransferase family 39 protein, partial [Acidisphaera sp.]|nr:glycosyltransferase family 39 protein [Acidisphaera sp.]
MWSRAPAWGYYDHPPMVAWLIALGAALAGDGALGIRLLAPVSACVGSILLSWALDRAYPATRPGIAASVLLNATLAFGAGAVTMTPDTPLLLFWTLAMAALLPVAATGRGWLGAGLAAGAALLSKYTALLFGVSVAVWLALVPPMRRWLIDLRPLAAACLAITLFVPVLWWNARHGWVSFAQQGGRIADFDPARAVRFTGELIAGQIGLATPGIAVLMTVGTVAAARRRDPVGGLLAALTVVPALVFAEHALGDRVQANWPAITYPSAAAAAAILGKPWARLRPAAAALGFAITGAVYLQAVAPLPLPRRLDPTLIRLAGWDRLAGDADTMRRQQGAAYLRS